jgi:hypothetical protein
VAELQSLVSGTSLPGAEFTHILPGAIDYAEGRLHRERDLLSTILRSSLRQLPQIAASSRATPHASTD